MSSSCFSYINVKSYIKLYRDWLFKGKEKRSKCELHYNVEILNQCYEQKFGEHIRVEFFKWNKQI